MARKSGSTIVQEELYPSSAPVRHDSAREEIPSQIDDARLIDLDVDEESPFLRGQKRVSARRSSLPKKTASRLLWGAAAATVVCVAGLAAAALYHYGEHSWRFRVESSDNIEVLGTQNVSKAQITEVMGADIGRNIFFIPLAQQKALLEQIPWVESASVMRFVPNRLHVVIHERTPVAFARVGPKILLIDAGGTLMDLPPKRKYSFPVILGMNPGEPLSTRAPRMKVYTEMLRELDAGGARYSQDLSEVDLSDLEDVKVRVNDPQGDVLVHLGSSDFLDRYKVYVTHAQGWRQQFQKLESVDLRYDNQIIVNPDVPQTARAGVNPVSTKTVVASLRKEREGWVAQSPAKPAALITRLPHDRAVPKPAFELSEKKLNEDAAGKPATKKVAKKNSVVQKHAGRVIVAKRGAAPAPRVGHARSTVQKPPPPVSHGATTSANQKPVATQKKPAAAVAVAKSSGGQKPSPAIGKDQHSQAANQ